MNISQILLALTLLLWGLSLTILPIPGTIIGILAILTAIAIFFDRPVAIRR